MTESTAAFGVRQLIRRETEIQQDRIDCPWRLPCRHQDVSQVREAGLMQAATRMLQRRRSPFEHRGVTIKTKQPALWSQFREDTRRMATTTDSPVDHSLAGTDPQPLKYLGHQDRDVARAR